MPPFTPLHVVVLVPPEALPERLEGSGGVSVREPTPASDSAYLLCEGGDLNPYALRR